MADVGQWNDFDKRCSTALTRSGLTALLLSVVAFALLQPLTRLRSYEDLGRYVSLRYEMLNYLQAMETDPCWTAIRQHSEYSGDDHAPLSRIISFQCEVDQAGYTVTRGAESSSVTKRPGLYLQATSGQSTGGSPVPAPPKNIKIVHPLNEAIKVVDLLTALFDNRLLASARHSSFETDLSIYRWQFNVLDLLYVRRSTIPARKDAIVAPHASLGIEEERKRPTRQTGQAENRLVSREDIVNFLTYADVKKIANNELPDLSKLEDPIKERIRSTSLSYGQMRWGPREASVLLEVSILLCLVYFWLFERELAKYDRARAPATLVAVFSQDRISRTVFFLLDSVPAIASALLVIRSVTFYPINFIDAGTALCVVFTAVMIASEARRAFRGM